MGWRKLTIGTAVWRWMVGTDNVVARNDETGEKHVIDLSRLTGVTWDQIERCRWKQTPFRILPSQIVKWLTLGPDTFTASPEETAKATTNYD